MKLENDNGEFVCVYFGQVDRYDTVNKFVDFYDNRHNIIQKSVYHRNYNIQNTIFDKCKRYNIQISTNDKNKILDIFEKIESVLPQINADRKRLINVNFTLKRTIKMRKLQYKNIPIYNQKEHQHFIYNIGVELKKLFGDDIKTNIRRVNFCEYSSFHLSSEGHVTSKTLGRVK